MCARRAFLSSVVRMNLSEPNRAILASPYSFTTGNLGGPGPHRHPYDEIQFIREGRGAWTVNGQTFEGQAGDIFVIKAGEIHSFKVIGDSSLVQVDVHLSPRFVQENL